MFLAMLSRPGEITRRHDPDRFLTALFAPPDRREALFVLYAVNHELARAREAVSEPFAAMIRLQWWREVAEGGRPRHEVAGPLGDAIDAGRLRAQDVLDMIEGRETETEEIESLPAWRDYLLATAGAVAVAAGCALDAPVAALDGLRQLGAGYGAAGVLRSVPALAAQGRCLLPGDVLAAHGLDAAAVIAAPSAPALQPVLASLAAEGETLLAAGRAVPVPRATIAAALPAVLARRDLRRPGLPARARGAADRFAVLAAAILGRI